MKPIRRNNNITYEEAREIRRLFYREGRSTQELAPIYRLSEVSTNAVIRGDAHASKVLVALEDDVFDALGVIASRAGLSAQDYVRGLIKGAVADMPGLLG